MRALVIVAMLVTSTPALAQSTRKPADVSQAAWDALAPAGPLIGTLTFQNCSRG
jgi:hypothetical protein